MSVKSTRRDPVCNIYQFGNDQTFLVLCQYEVSAERANAWTDVLFQHIQATEFDSFLLLSFFLSFFLSLSLSLSEYISNTKCARKFKTFRVLHLFTESLFLLRYWIHNCGMYQKTNLLLLFFENWKLMHKEYKRITHFSIN
jgi:hypothetical protein